MSCRSLPVRVFLHKTMTKDARRRYTVQDALGSDYMKRDRAKMETLIGSERKRELQGGKGASQCE